MYTRCRGDTAARAGDRYFAVCRHSLENLSGAADISGAVDVGDSELPRGQCIMDRELARG